MDITDTERSRLQGVFNAVYAKHPKNEVFGSQRPHPWDGEEVHGQLCRTVQRSCRGSGSSRVIGLLRMSLNPDHLNIIVELPSGKYCVACLC